MNYRDVFMWLCTAICIGIKEYFIRPSLTKFQNTARIIAMTTLWIIFSGLLIVICQSMWGVMYGLWTVLLLDVLFGIGRESGVSPPIKREE